MKKGTVHRTCTFFCISFENGLFLIFVGFSEPYFRGKSYCFFFFFLQRLVLPDMSALQFVFISFFNFVLFVREINSLSIRAPRCRKKEEIKQ